MKTTLFSLTGCLLAASLFVSAPVFAAPNPVTGVQTGNPDIFYRSGTGQGCLYDGATLTITGQPLTLVMVAGDREMFITGGTVTVNADIDSTGTFISGNSNILITGMAGSFANPLLEGTINNYGIADLGATDRVEFTFDVTGGSLAADFGAEGGMIATIENSTYAGSFGANWDCGLAKGNIGPTSTTPPVVTGSGTGTLGYWKNHPDAWPVLSVTVGEQTFAMDAAIALMKMATKGDKSISMLKQLIPAKLNVEAGNDASCINDTIFAADQWIILHGGVAVGQKRWDNGDLLHDELDAYNNGLLCAPHRD